MKTISEMVRVVTANLIQLDPLPPRELTELEKLELVDKQAIADAQARIRQRADDLRAEAEAEHRGKLEAEARQIEATAVSVAAELTRGVAVVTKGINVIAKELTPLIENEDHYIECERSAARLRAEGIAIDLPPSPMGAARRELLTVANYQVVRAWEGFNS